MKYDKHDVRDFNNIAWIFMLNNNSSSYSIESNIVPILNGEIIITIRSRLAYLKIK